MANKRMFSVDVVETDAFLDLPPKAQALYFHLGMRADDDGFVASPRSIMRVIGCNAGDLKRLEAAGYVISFDSGVLVVTDWKINNTLKNDRHRKTVFQNEFALLEESTSKRYILSNSGTISEPCWNQNGNQLEPQYSIEKDRVVESSLAEQQQPTAPPAACAPLKGARGGSTVLGSSLDNGDRDAATDEARRKFFDSIKRPAWPAAKAAPPDVEKEE